MIDNTVLISGAPMRFGGILFRQPTLEQIYRDPDVGKAVYDSYLYLVSLDVEGFLQATGLTDVYMKLPRDIRVLSARVVPDGFHARYAAHSKTYLYRIRNSPIDSPFEERYYCRIPGRLDVERMQRAAAHFVGTHDFLALCAAHSSAAAHGDTVRTITACGAERHGDTVEITVTADGYLYNMVRILAGTLCEAGAGRLDPEAVPAILASRDRCLAGPTLPAKGLFLHHVDYGKEAEG